MGTMQNSGRGKEDDHVLRITIIFFKYTTNRVVLSPIREPDPGRSIHFCDSLPDGRTGSETGNHETSLR
jgi:hypothetical protein